MLSLITAIIGLVTTIIKAGMFLYQNNDCLKRKDLKRCNRSKSSKKK